MSEERVNHLEESAWIPAPGIMPFDYYAGLPLWTTPSWAISSKRRSSSSCSARIRLGTAAEIIDWRLVLNACSVWHLLLSRGASPASRAMIAG
jgi:hypothetical protein